MITIHTVFFGSLYFASAFFPLQANNNRAETKKSAGQLISKVSYRSSGGRSGNYERLDISADSTIYIQARRGTEKEIKERTSKRDWNGLTNSINVKDFGRIKSNPGHALYDGIDITITLETEGKNYSIVNGNEDTVNYKRIRPFTNLLEKRLAGLRKKINW
jgi:hypothetical protein